MCNPIKANSFSTYGLLSGGFCNLGFSSLVPWLSVINSFGDLYHLVDANVCLKCWFSHLVVCNLFDGVMFCRMVFWMTDDPCFLFSLLGYGFFGNFRCSYSLCLMVVTGNSLFWSKSSNAFAFGNIVQTKIYICGFPYYRSFNHCLFDRFPVGHMDVMTRCVNYWVSYLLINGHFYLETLKRATVVMQFIFTDKEDN